MLHCRFLRLYVMLANAAAVQKQCFTLFCYGVLWEIDRRRHMEKYLGLRHVQAHTVGVMSQPEMSYRLQIGTFITQRTIIALTDEIKEDFLVYQFSFVHTLRQTLSKQ